jgi:hypothetical protein
VRQVVTSLGGTFPKGASESPWWEASLGNHHGVRSVAVDATGLYFGVGGSESSPNAAKLDRSGSTRLWSAEQPAAFMGRNAMAVAKGELYSLGQDGRVYVHPVDRPNRRTRPVGTSGGPGRVWDAHRPGDPRPAWDDQAAAPDPRISPDAWRDEFEAAVTAPKGVAFDAAGQLLVATGDRVVRVDRAGGAVRPFLSGLTAPYRLDLDRATGDVLVAERAPSRRVKRFSAGGELRATYGAEGGRTEGGPLDRRDAFGQALDLAADGEGGFLLAEDDRVSPRRVVRVGADGKIAREWWASTA